MAEGWWFEVRQTGASSSRKWLVGIKGEQTALARLAKEVRSDDRITRLREASIIELDHYGVSKSHLRQI